MKPIALQSLRYTKLSLTLASTLILLFVSGIANSNDLTQCTEDLNESLSQQSEAIHQEYFAISQDGKGLDTNKHPRLLIPLSQESNGEAVLLYHGFTASPMEVEALGNELAARGYTVFMPLIRGFGSDFNVANRYNARDWKEGYAESVTLLGKCFKSIHVAGLSLGGGLTIDYLLSQTSQENRVQISSAVLIAPYTKPKQKLAGLLGAIMDVPKNGISFQALYKFTKNPDIALILRNSDGYTNKFPVTAGSAIADFGRNLRKQIGKLEEPIVTSPTLLIYSGADRTIRIKNMLSSVKSTFTDLQILELDKELQAPHQIVVDDPANASHLDSTISSIIEFIDSN